MYDIYLRSGCKSTPDLKDFIEQCPAIGNPEVQTLCLSQQIRPGFLGLDLPDALAYSLLERLIAAKASACRVPITYRQPRITREEAQMIAEQAFLQQQRTEFPDQMCGPTVFKNDQIISWTFRTTLAGKYRFAHVDKLDGHLCQEAERSFLYAEEHAIRLAFKQSRARAAGLPMTRWHENYRTYDIRIRELCRTAPKLDDFFDEIPALRDEAMQRLLLLSGDAYTPEQNAFYKVEPFANEGSFMQKVVYCSVSPFLRLNLSYELAGRLAMRLQQAGAWANRLPIEYRDPPITLQQAELLAQERLVAIKATRFPNKPVGSVQVNPNWPLWEPYWLFMASSEELEAKGYIPGYISISVDKIDGHSWDFDERYLFIDGGRSYDRAFSE